MRKLAIGIVVVALVSLLFAATKTDNRQYLGFPIAKYAATQLSFAPGDANVAATTLYNLNGLVERIDIIISDGNNADNAVVTYTENGTTMGTFSVSMDSSQRIVKRATSDSTDFDAIPACGNLVFSIDPNGGPGGVTMTVDFDVYVR